MLNLIHLKYFHDSVQEGSLAGGARKNLVTPSAVSQALRQLEQHFDCRLICHKKNRFDLSDEGHLLYKECQAIFLTVENIELAIRSSKKELSGDLSFATQQSIANSILPPILAQLKALYPQVIPRIQLGTTTSVKKMVERGDVEFALTLDNVRVEGTRCQPVRKGSFLFAGNEKFFKLKHNLPLLLTDELPEIRGMARAYREKFHEEPKALMKVHSWSVLFKLAQAGLGIAYIPDYLVHPLPQGMKISYLGLPKIPYSILLTHRKGHQLSKKAQAFVQELEKYFKESRGPF